MLLEYKCLLSVTLFKQTKQLIYVSVIDITFWSNDVMFNFDLRDNQKREYERKKPFVET